MPREEQPRDTQGVAGIHTGTPWDSVYPIAARFTNWAARTTRSLTHGVIHIGVGHDTDLNRHQREVLIRAGGAVNPPGVKHERGRAAYFWQGERISKKQARRIVHAIRQGRIPATASLPPVIPPPPIKNGPTAADQAAQPFTDYGFVAHLGQRSRGRKKKRKSRLRDAAAILAAATERTLMTGEELFSSLLNKEFVPRGGTVRTVVNDLERLLSRDFVPGAARVATRTAASVILPAAARAAGVLGGLLWPSAIGQEPPWSPPRVPGTRPAAPRVPARPAPARPMPHPLPQSPVPRPLTRVSSPAPRPLPSPRPVLSPVASPAPSPGTMPRPAVAPGRAPIPHAFPTWLLAPLAAGFAAPGRLARAPRRVVVPAQQPWPSPLTAPSPKTLTSPSGDSCNCQRPTRTRRERKKRCTNPIINRRRSGDTITITRRIKCPA